VWLAGLLVAAVGAVITQAATGWMGSIGSEVSERVIGAPAPLTLDVSPPSPGQPLYFPDAASELEPVPSPGEGEVAREAWGRAMGGTNAYSTGFRVVIQGTSQSSVVLTGLSIRVLERRPAPRGTVVDAIGAGGAPARYFTVDLDEPAPEAVFDFGESSAGSDRRISFPYHVTESEPEVFFIFAGAQRCDCTWVAELSWSAEGRSGVAVIDDDGRPFRTVSGEAATRYRATEEGLLEPSPPT
jgi:hypothetical protein